MKKVELIASGYEFKCPVCDTHNKITSVTLLVNCKHCKTRLKVSDYIHAIG